MAFYGKSFSFNGKSCAEFDLEVMDIGNHEQKTGSHTSVREPIEDRLNRKLSPLYYGSKQNKPLKFPIVCCLNEARAASGKPLARWEIEDILRWLTGPDGYCYLEFSQSDMQDVRYKAMVSEIEDIDLSWQTWGISISFICDSAFGYTYPSVQVIESNGATDAIVYSRSTHTGIYHPIIRIDFTGQSRTVSIQNTDLPSTSKDRIMTFTNVPSGVHSITINTETQVMTTDSGDDIYAYCNFGFTGLVPENNHLAITGDCTVTITSEFPVNIGG